VPCILVEGCRFSRELTASLRVESSILMVEVNDSFALVIELARPSEIQCTSVSLHGKIFQKTAVSYGSLHRKTLKSGWMIVILKFEGQGWDCCALSCLLEKHTFIFLDLKFKAKDYVRDLCVGTRDPYT
jgi:hypothetical protein